MQALCKQTKAKGVATERSRRTVPSHDRVIAWRLACHQAPPSIPRHASYHASGDHRRIRAGRATLRCRHSQPGIRADELAPRMGRALDGFPQSMPFGSAVAFEQGSSSGTRLAVPARHDSTREERDAAERLGIIVRTLQKWRLQRTGRASSSSAIPCGTTARTLRCTSNHRAGGPPPNHLPVRLDPVQTRPRAGSCLPFGPFSCCEGSPG